MPYLQTPDILYSLSVVCIGLQGNGSPGSLQACDAHAVFDRSVTPQRTVAEQLLSPAVICFSGSPGLLV
jgi:hypothetical protein